jgi:hypothetical protein
MCLPQSTRRLSRRGRSRSRPFCFLQVRIAEPSPQRHQPMTSQGTAQRPLPTRDSSPSRSAAEMAARETPRRPRRGASGARVCGNVSWRIVALAFVG